ncbi:MAG: tRNA (N6-isopentenyl adenosine(37)-C2)-methylthiotransferase MiaB [Bacteroidota bacterium]
MNKLTYFVQCSTMIYPHLSRRVYIETYGCQMNLADSELVGGILDSSGYLLTDDLSSADVVLLNTCSIRDNAEQRIHRRLSQIREAKRTKPGLVLGILGCMAERLRSKFLEQEQLVDLVVGPDEYRKLPGLVEAAVAGEKGIAVRLSRVESYEDVVPFRTEGISAWLSAMRGCDKFCTFCVVPFTRGRERSRPHASIVREVENLSARGFKEVTLLGQNVNSYRDGSSDFADLMRSVAAVDRDIRVRFTTSHPQDFPARLVQAIATTSNICNHIHLPVQSGSDRILGLMNRSYTRDQFLRLVRSIRSDIPAVSLSTDIIAGFPTEKDEDHQMTLDLLREVGFDGAYTFKYSPRENTKAWKMQDDVTEEVKGARVSEISKLQHKISLVLNTRLIGTTERVLVEGPSRKSDAEYAGRTDTNKVVIFTRSSELPGAYRNVRIREVTSATLLGDVVAGSDSQLERKSA